MASKLTKRRLRAERVDTHLRRTALERQRANLWRSAGRCPGCKAVPDRMVVGPWGDLWLVEAWCGEHYWAIDRKSGRPVLALGYRMDRTNGLDVRPAREGAPGGDWWYRHVEGNEPPVRFEMINPYDYVFQRTTP